MERKSYFKIVFWILAALLGVAILTGIGFVIYGSSIDPEFPIGFMIYFILFLIVLIAVLVSISLFVYKDASKRGMDPWMWMTIALFVPNMIGLIIYLIVRKGNDVNRKKCMKCGKSVKEDYKMCPYCGEDLNLKCPVCSKEISSEWQVCPYCSSSLK